MLFLLATTTLVGCHNAGSTRFRTYCADRPLVRNEFGYIELTALGSLESQGLADLRACRPRECLRLLTVLMLRHCASDVEVHHTATFLQPQDHPCVTAFYELSGAQRCEGGALSGDVYRWVLRDAPTSIAGDPGVRELVKRIQAEQKAYLREGLGEEADNYELQPDGSWEKK
jgi:hypothetical protein